MYGDSGNLSLNSNSYMYVRNSTSILVGSGDVGDGWYVIKCMHFFRRWYSGNILKAWPLQLRHKLNTSMTGCSSTKIIEKILSWVSSSRCTIRKFVKLVNDIWIFEFEGGVSITSGIEVFTNSGSVIMSDLIKTSVTQIDHCYWTVTITYI